MDSGQDQSAPPFSVEQAEQELWVVCSSMFDKGRSLDRIHTRISIDYALRLLYLLRGDRRIVVPAVMLHDIGNSVISAKDLEKKTINPGTAASEKSYSTELKKKHMAEGATLSTRILRRLGYSEDRVVSIAEIVGDHESPDGGFPEDVRNIDKVIVSDADKLYRYSAHGFSSMCRIHGISTKEMLQLNIRKMDEWLITEEARRIAIEELRKTPGAESLEALMAL